MSDEEAINIAIIGIDLDLPGSHSLNEVVATALRGQGNASPISSSRLRDSSTGTTPEEHHDGGYFDRIDLFDYQSFGLSARVAESMDPYQRFCLLSSTRAIADAGLTTEISRLRAGVYGSCNGSQQGEYARLQREHDLEPDVMGNLAPSIAARISNILDLRGPAVMVDTACSSSLYALTLACDALRAGSIDIAVVTSANLYVAPGPRDSVAVKVVSERSQTRAFDLAADGASVGEGVVTLILQRVADVTGPHYGDVVAWCSNQDGRTATMSSPNPRAQVDLIEEAWTGFDPAELGLYVAHGTGTAIGDLMELEGLCDVVPFDSVRRQSIPLVAPKSNFGHLDAASGLLSVCLAIAATSSGRVAPHPSFVAPLFTESLVRSAFFIPVEEERIAKRSLGAVSAFGITGTNVHVVVRGGARLPRPCSDKKGGVELRRCWFSPRRNSFAKAGSHPATESFGVVSRIYDIETFRDWEIAEHRVQGNPLMVGTSLIELLNELLVDSNWRLTEYDLVDLHLHRPLSATEPQVQILASLDTVTLRGMVRSRESDRSWTVWATFGLRARRPMSALPTAPNGDGLDAVDVSTAVGDDTVEVSPRWSVVSSMRVASDNNSGVLELEAPLGMSQEFSKYAFYPALIDAALNGMNRVIHPDDVLLPWTCDQIILHVPRLTGDRFVAHIRKRSITADDHGNVVLTVDADVWLSDGTCAFSARGYRVKNQMRALAPAGVFNDIIYCPYLPPVQAEENVVFVPVHLLDEMAVTGATIPYELGVIELSDESFGEARRAIIVLDLQETEPRAEEVLFDFGQLLLHIHLESGIDHVTIICPGSLGDVLHPVARAASALAYSLRTEFRFDVAIVDGPPTAETVAAVRGHHVTGLSQLTGSGSFETARFARFPLFPRQDWGGGSFIVVIIGASSGIGRAYAEYLLSQYPNVSVIGVGRRATAEFSSERVTYFSADISVPSDVAMLAEAAADARYVINFAGEPSKGLFITKGRAEFNAAMNSKVNGSALLLNQFQSVDEIILVSSVAGAVGAMGQADYAAANAYQVALAEGHGSSTRRIRSVSLSGWRDVGMAADLEDDIFEKVGVDEGIQQLHAYVTSEASRAYIFRARPNVKSYSPLLSTPAEFSKRREAETQARRAPRDTDESHRLVTEAWNLVLGPGEYDADTSFFEYGGDSISIVQLCDALNQSCGETFDVTTLFDCSTINKQTKFLHDSFHEKTIDSQRLPDISDIFRMLNKTEEAH